MLNLYYSIPFLNYFNIARNKQEKLLLLLLLQEAFECKGQGLSVIERYRGNRKKR